MIYTNDYESPLGHILLAGDKQGFGLRKAAGMLGLGWKKKPIDGKRTILIRRKSGWIFIFPVVIPGSFRGSIW